MEGHCSTVQSPQWAVVPMEEEVMICILVGPEDDSIRIETCYPDKIINIIKFCCVCYIIVYIYVCIFITYWHK